MDTATFHIVAIGPPGAGKTVYLAALNHALTAASQSLGPGIKATVAEADQRSWLREVYDKMALSASGNFPPKTKTGDIIRQVTFRFAVSWTQRSPWGRLRKRNFPVFDVSYVDYAGEIPTQANRQAGEVLNPFLAYVEQAHVLLGIIDGIKLLRFMEGDELSSSFMYEQLGPIVEYMNETEKILHFVVTKWDVFDGKFTFAQVRERLISTGDGGFRKLVAENTAQATWRRRPLGRIRLIPVSSVGQLAALVPGSNDVKIIPGRPATPVNVEVPLIAAVYDVCEFAEQLMRERVAKADVERAGTQVEQVGKAFRPYARGGPDVTFFGLGINLEKFASFVATKGPEVVRMLGRPAVKVGRSMRRSARKVRARGIHGVTSDLGALYYLMNRLQSRMQKFEAEEPGSTLTAEFAAPAQPPEPTGPR